MSNMQWGLLLMVALGCGAMGEELVCCGADEVFMIDSAKPAVKGWSWRAADSGEIPESFHGKFRTTDDCKPYTGGLLLVTSSSGGVALIEREGKKCVFLADCRNAHSGCLLPDKGLVVASSYGGDQLVFFKLDDAGKPATPVQQLPLVGAHGVVWDTKRKCLWGLGGEELVKLTAGERGKWSVSARHPLPSSGGHDLSETHDGVNLFVTTDTQVLKFDRNDSTFAAHGAIGDREKVKSVDLHRKTKVVVFHQATKEHWWSDTVRIVGGEPIRLEGEQLYKVRWDVEEKRP